MTTLIPREEALQMAVEAAYDVPGNILEFGVYQGESTRTIIRTLAVNRPGESGDSLI
jgi:hypothetical protein